MPKWGIWIRPPRRSQIRLSVPICPKYPILSRKSRNCPGLDIVQQSIITLAVATGTFASSRTPNGTGTPCPGTLSSTVSRSTCCQANRTDREVPRQTVLSPTRRIYPTSMATQQTTPPYTTTFPQFTPTATSLSSLATKTRPRIRYPPTRFQCTVRQFPVTWRMIHTRSHYHGLRRLLSLMMHELLNHGRTMRESCSRQSAFRVL
jgi:hypothetical protein